MKQLKFMLAAATAIGLATASQADTQLVKTPFSSENFDGVTTLEDTAALMALDGFTYEGATATDNESYVVAGGANESANALKVNTGTDPLLRKIYPAGAATGVPLDATKKVYIDTMVQFTVTPEGDTVTAGDNDKLMIYLKEVPAVKADDGTVTTPASSKLMVKAASFSPGGENDEGDRVDETKDPTDVTVTYEDGSYPEVASGEWYDLKVEVKSLNGVPVFNVYLGNLKLYASTPLYRGNNDRSIFPSLLGTSSATLDKVGFAGEGMVDELVFSQDVEQQTSVDFTFTLAWDAAGFSSVTYTIDGGEPVTPENGGSFTVPDTKKLVIAYTLNDWYKISGTPVLEYTAAVNETDSLTLEAVKTAAVVDGKIEVTESTKPADVGITTGSFAADTTPVAELNKALTWATTKAGAAASAAGALVGQLDFTDETETPAEQAYLLNCDPNDTEELKAAKDNFKFDPEDLASLFNLDGVTTEDLQNTLFSDKGYNGSIILEGTESLGGTWEVRKNGHKFFRARLVK